MKKGHSKRSTEISLKFSQNNFVSGLKIKKQLIKIAPYSQRLNRGARPKYPVLEDEQLKIVTRYIIQEKTRYLAKKISHQERYSDIKDAKFSQRWLISLSRYNLVNRSRTTVIQRLSKYYVE